MLSSRCLRHLGAVNQLVTIRVELQTAVVMNSTKSPTGKKFKYCGIVRYHDQLNYDNIMIHPVRFTVFESLVDATDNGYGHVSLTPELPNIIIKAKVRNHASGDITNLEDVTVWEGQYEF